MSDIQLLRRLDMNLLLIFASIARHQKLSAAAEELKLTKSAISHALNRLRSIFGDELFIRRRNGVQMTARAMTVAPKITRIIEMTSDALMIQRSFDPRNDQRTLRFGTIEYGAVLFGPALAEIMQRESPRMHLSIAVMRRAQLLEQTANYNLDLALCNFFGGTGNLTTENLYSERYVVVARKNHPLIRSRLTRNIYLNAEHLTVVAEAQPPVILESTFAKLGISRNVVMTLPLYSPAFAVAARTDRLLTAPERLSRLYAKSFGLDVYAMPFPPIDVAVSLVSHPNVEHDPVAVWFREKVRAVAAVI
jgi:DNA-binding transcriptional LysR family regulator